MLVLRFPTSGFVREESGLDIHVNRWEDAESFFQTERWLTKSQFLSEVAVRRAQGLRFYSVVEGGLLIYYSWVVPDQSKAWFPVVGMHYEFPKGTAVIFNAYTHSLVRGRGIHKKVLKKQIEDAARVAETSFVYIAVDPKNVPARLAVEAVGFEAQALLWEKVRFGSLSRGLIVLAKSDS